MSCTVVAGNFRTVPMAGVTFEGYPDPLIDLYNSKLVQTLINITAPNLPLPHVPAMGYFPNVSVF